MICGFAQRKEQHWEDTLCILQGALSQSTDSRDVGKSSFLQGSSLFNVKDMTWNPILSKIPTTVVQLVADKLQLIVENPNLSDNLVQNAFHFDVSVSFFFLPFFGHAGLELAC